MDTDLGCRGFTHTQCLPNMYDQPTQRGTMSLTLGLALHADAAADDLSLETDMDEFNNPGQRKMLPSLTSICGSIPWMY